MRHDESFHNESASQIESIVNQWSNENNISERLQGRLCGLDRETKIFYENNNEQLTSLPNIFHLLPNLIALSLRGNRLESLPPTIGKLKKLIRLDIANNNLPNIPSAIYDLANLEVLELDGNGLSPKIGSMVNLRKLYINDDITSLPPEIGNLKNLEVLEIGTASNNFASFARRDIGWMSKHLDQLKNCENSTFDNLITYSEHLRSLNEIDNEEGGLEQLLEDLREPGGHAELWRRIDKLSGNFYSRITNLYTNRSGSASSRSLEGVASTQSLELQELDASRSVVNPNGTLEHIPTVIGNRFENNREKYPYLRIGIEIEAGIPMFPGMLTVYPEKHYKGNNSMEYRHLYDKLLEWSQNTNQARNADGSILFDPNRRDLPLNPHELIYAGELQEELQKDILYGSLSENLPTSMGIKGSKDSYADDVTVRFKKPYYGIEFKSKILGLAKSLEEVQNVTAALNDLGGLYNKTTGVQVHVGLDHFKTGDLGLDKVDQKWDQELDAASLGLGEFSKYDRRNITPYQLLVVKQFIVNMLSVEDIFSKVASYSYIKPHNFDKNQYHQISQTKNMDDLVNLLQPAPVEEFSDPTRSDYERRRYNVNLLSFVKHGTIELRSMISKNSEGMGVDPNMSARGGLFAQELMIKTLEQVKDIIPKSPDEVINLHPAKDIEKIANEYVEDIALLEVIHAMNHRVSGYRENIMSNIVNSRDLISPMAINTINAMQNQGCFPENDPLGTYFIDVLNGKAQWGPSAQMESQNSEGEKCLRRKFSTRKLGDDALAGLRSQQPQSPTTSRLSQESVGGEASAAADMRSEAGSQSSPQLEPRSSDVDETSPFIPGGAAQPSVGRWKMFADLLKRCCIPAPRKPQTPSRNTQSSGREAH